MAIPGKNSKKPNKVNGLTPKELSDILIDLQGRIDHWCAQWGIKTFIARDLVGGKNSDWKGTVLYPLYTKQQTIGATKKIVAGQELGRIFKCVILNGKRDFTCNRGSRSNEYTLI